MVVARLGLLPSCLSSFTFSLLKENRKERQQNQLSIRGGEQGRRKT